MLLSSGDCVWFLASPPGLRIYSFINERRIHKPMIFSIILFLILSYSLIEIIIVSGYHIQEIGPWRWRLKTMYAPCYSRGVDMVLLATGNGRMMRGKTSLNSRRPWVIWRGLNILDQGQESLCGWLTYRSPSQQQSWRYRRKNDRLTESFWYAFWFIGVQWHGKLSYCWVASMSCVLVSAKAVRTHI